MEYTINKLAKLAGVSTRTLRYYEEFGLLAPARISSNGYRIYGQREVDLLQQILFYRELDVPLEEIRRIVAAKDFDGAAALEGHLTKLRQRRDQLERLIVTVEKTIRTQKGEDTMSDNEKFEGLKQKMIDDNEKAYGQEARQKYGNKAVDASNAKLKGMSREQYAEAERLSKELNETLKAACELGDPASDLAQLACDLHRQWLSVYWTSYSKEAHLGVTEMYVEDPRFTAYYEKIAPGCAKFLRDAVVIYCK